MNETKNVQEKTDIIENACMFSDIPTGDTEAMNLLQEAREKAKAVRA